ncbi:PREDICTED: LON peptidase N-terminal domain and RING finger protein 3-like [Camelina sativa]|uniref:LON peptidase N-terminal domain and RING finger protein 3-like n=1 Tax=Camelina sativa TaxID=90675 RepID=A0ABM0UG44_CAMSA|nr:PREDICTED: LON peptidase N-terminal domain and RING finger protein 3-like [Camelina sativa]XP_010440652.1 PREDICTED: LON peptidase N-terminal domain and RING finger protein 3-like [Camelina sativa]
MIQMDGGDRLRVTFLDRMSTVENGRSSVTLEDILMAETSGFRSLTAPSSPARNHSNGSLLDVMRRERRRDKTAWKSFRDKLRLKRTSTGWISSNNPIPTLDSPIRNLNSESHRLNRLGGLLSNSETDRSSGDVSNGGDEAVEREGRRRLGTVLAADREEVQPPRMSLMELLEDNDGQMYDVCGEREAVEVEAEAEGRNGCGGGEAVGMTATAELSCCVCMIRSKGAAFIPCGHTFCRLCSRELWVQRGNCPLCNTTILQVLDIF